jgi:3-methylcrotonyl-CoA carboxylase beta subunit
MATIQKVNIEFNRNEDAMKLLVAQMRKKLDRIYTGGGKKAIEKHKSKGKLTARERIDLLVDKDTYLLELGEFAGYEMYEEHGGCPAGGVICVLGYVSGRLCVIVANDATVKAGAWFPIAGKKNLRAQEIAMENKLPIIYLVDSAGVYLPMQDEIFPDKEHFGRIFRNNARMSSEGTFQVAAVMGSCVAGGAYLPIMSDESLIVEGTGSIFLAGPYLVKAAIGEDIDQETLGGATTQTETSGTMPDDISCLKRIREIISTIAKQDTAGFDRIESRKPVKPEKEINGYMAENNSKPYDVQDIINSVIDEESWIPFKENYGKTIVCGYARIDGWAAGIVANQRKVVKSAKNEMQIGGVIYSDSADKAARFIMNCNQKKVPLVFLQDVSGFMVGSRSEHGGIIKDGAKLVNAVSNSVVPKITIVAGNSYGAGNYAMCGKAYDPRFIYAWPTAKIAVMGGDQAAKTLLQIQVASQKAKGKEVTPEKEQELLKTIKDHYEKTTTPYYAAARLWVDKIIDPTETRKIISISIEAANHAPITKQFNTGVLQT